MARVRKLQMRLNPVLAYRRRGMTAVQFEEQTASAIFEAGQMLESASEDAQLLLATLVNMSKLNEFEGDERERYVFAYLHLRAMEMCREKANPFSLIELIEIVFSNTNSAKALLKHAPHRKARDFIRAEWDLHRSEYDNNKSAFARDYVRRVWNEMNVSVTEKQVREVWLRDTPPAGKQAGLPAGG